MKQKWKFDSLERFYLHWRDLVFTKEKKKARLGEDKDLTLPNILKAGEDQSKNWLSPKDKDTKNIDEQKLKNEGLEREKDHFALVVEKGCNYESWG